MHAPILGLCMSTDAARIVLHLQDCAAVPVACLHNTPATYVKLPAYIQPAKEIEAPKRPMRRLLKKEVSLDTYTWQKKYGHLTSSAMVAAVEERLKRRFSVSASMEEISKIPGSAMGSQPQCKQELERFLQHLNSQHPSIKFTMDIERDKQLPFLDVLVKEDNGKFGHSVYQKRTHMDQYLNTTSHHHLMQKISLIRTLVHRAYKLSDADPIDAEREHLMALVMGTAIPWYGENL
ncbi:hypothetical protein J437_LFUL015261 [Ladona fulva]|uniref:Helix-turn-helix domain-containing protein n=1 Tax=Ladona fulva TaxID=123851 RepID=A0A8K0KPY5_LADFU|nr:hypothetical protein J437_LFUL015261 [Ladona fulva]